MIGETENFWFLLRNLPHWEFELFLMALFDGVVGALVWPRIKRHIHRDVARAEQHPTCACLCGGATFPQEADLGELKYRSPS